MPEATQETLPAGQDQKESIETKVDEILTAYKGEKAELIPILQQVQECFGYLPEDALSQIASFVNEAACTVFGVATFYAQFKLVPTGRNLIRVCRGTACHVLGSATVLKKLEKQLKCKAGQTTRDGLFSIEVVACIGACGLAPVININGTFHAKVTEESIVEIINTYLDKEHSEEK